MTNDEKSKRKPFIDNHLSNKVQAKKLMNLDKEKASNNDSFCCASFDLQKVLTTPKSDVSVMYYYCKLCIWNLTVFELGTETGKCNLWNQTVSKRGSNEFASIIYGFIQKKVAVRITEFGFFTDNCSSQNRNKNLFAMYKKAANEFRIIISHRLYKNFIQQRLNKKCFSF